MAYTATIVLPLPTSPCSSRFIGSGRPMSAAISAIACSWPGGQLEGKQPADAGVDLGRGLQRRGLALVVLLPALHGQGQLQDEQLLVDEPPPRPGQALVVGGEWISGSAWRERPEVVGFEVLGRERPRPARSA